VKEEEKVFSSCCKIRSLVLLLVPIVSDGVRVQIDLSLYRKRNAFVSVGLIISAKAVFTTEIGLRVD